MTRRFGGPALGLLTGLVVAGCGGGDEKRFDVSGAVKYAGKDIPRGIVYFDPDGTKGTKGTQGYADILDGKYDTAATGGKGVTPGHYVVRVTGFDGKPSGGESPYGKALFNETEYKKEFPAAKTTWDIDVPKK